MFDKLSALFSEALERNGLPSDDLEMTFNESERVLDVTLPLPNVADWDLRYRILDVATEVGDEHGATVRCFFRPAHAVARH